MKEHLMELYEEAPDHIFTDTHSIKRFLQQNQYLYKYSMRDILFIHSQNQEATFVANHQQWLKVGRNVENNEKPIVIIEERAGVLSERLLFDVTQTFGHEFSVDFMEKLNGGTIYTIANESYRELSKRYGLDKPYLRNIVFSTVYSKTTCDVDYLNRAVEDLWDSQIDVIETLKEIERANQVSKEIVQRLSVKNKEIMEQRGREKAIPMDEQFLLVLKRGSGFEDGKLRMAYWVDSNLGSKEVSNKIMKEYLHSKVDSSGFRYDTDSRGLHVTHANEHTSFSWSKVAKVIKKLHEAHEYLTEEQEKAYKLYLNEHPLLKEENAKKAVSEQTSPDNIEGQMSLFELMSEDELFDDSESSGSKKNTVTIETEVIVEDKQQTTENDQAIETNNTQGIEQPSFHFQKNSLTYAIKPLEKIEDNVRALECLDKLEKAQRIATKEEQAVLSKYVGWGGLTQVFDTRKQDASGTLKALRTRIRSVVTEEQYEAMEESSLTAYYTDPMIVKQMYEKLKKMGFHSGTILDPAAGTGNFYSAMPQDMRQQSRLYGVELDEITGKIFKYLHPDVNVQIKGFEFTKFEGNSFDLIVGNIPFNNFKIGKRGEEALVHDYFLNKSMELVKEGGIVAFITSTGTLDKSSRSEREKLVKKAELLGAVRLPNTAFKGIAGTDITTDIIFLQKVPKKREYSPDWVFTQCTREVPNGYNKYFVQNPQQVLGTLEILNFNGGKLTVRPFLDSPFEQQLEHALERIEGSFHAEQMNRKETNPAYVTSQVEKPLIQDLETWNMRSPQNFSYFIGEDNNVYYQEDEKKLLQKLSGTSFGRVRGLIKLRDHLYNVIDIQQEENYSIQTFDAALEQLNHVYDKFQQEFGSLHDKRNERVFRQDNSFHFLLSTEVKNNKGDYYKGDIYSKATIRPKKTITEVASAKEALLVSLNTLNKVDISYMTSLYRGDKESMMKELSEELFFLPTGEWVTKEAYLSGDVKTKYTEAQEWKKTDERFVANVEALKSVLPKDLTKGDIDLKIGSAWIPLKFHQQFIIEQLSVKSQYIENGWVSIDYNPAVGRYFIHGKSLMENPKNRNAFGTKRASVGRILEDSLNLTTTTVKDSFETPEGTKKYVVNSSETLLARDKQEYMQRAFKEWIFALPERTEEVLAIYNEKFNRNVVRRYDGSYLEFEGLNPLYELRPHQKNAVARIVADKRALLGHVVGAGKTLTMIAGGMKLKELGAIHKPLYVVPNHLTSEFGQELLRFYPTKKILVTTKKDFEKDNRKQFISKIATGEYDAIIIGQSQFERIPISRERQIAIMRKEVAEISQKVLEQKFEDRKSWSFKQMKLFEKKLKEKLDKLVNSKEKESPITFEQLGVDFLFIDEAHAYKNLYTQTKLTNVAGVQSSNSQRASDMLMKIQYIQEQYNQTGVVFATGTPISNSMSEMYTMQRYLQPDVLEQMGVKFFDDWASTFGEIESSLEIRPEGSGYQMKNRFAKFHNLPELMTTFSLVADIQTEDMLNLPTPKMKNGKATLILSEASEEQQLMMEQFISRAERIREGLVEPQVDNMLKLTNEAKMMALDMRLVDNRFGPEDSTKISRCCDKVFSIYKESNQNKSTQIIFSDTGTPKKNVFNVYDEVKTQLMEKGIPSEEIVFIHDAKNEKQRELMFEKVRTGDIRIILGSTSKVGTGTNIQDKLLAAHHLDCPWRPSDLTQRDGRIVRQGNENKEVAIYRYITKGTFDSYLWQIQEQKLRYISQVMTNRNISRSCDDIDETVIDASEAKAAASSNPLIAEKASIDNQVNKLMILKQSYYYEQKENETLIRETLPRKISFLRENVKQMNQDLASSTTDESREPFVIDGVYYEERTKAGEALISKVKEKKMVSEDILEIGEYQGFKMTVRKSTLSSYVLTCEKKCQYKVELNLSSPVGSISRIENMINKIPETLQRKTAELEATEHELVESKKIMNHPFSKQKELDDLLSRQTKLNLAIEASLEPKRTVHVAKDQQSQIR